MEFKGTKGKWEVSISNKQLILTDNGAYSPNAMHKTISTDLELNANALLISKAPEMLVMLKNMYSKYQEKGHLLDVSPSAIERLIKEATEI